MPGRHRRRVADTERVREAKRGVDETARERERERERQRQRQRERERERERWRGRDIFILQGP